MAFNCKNVPKSDNEVVEQNVLQCMLSLVRDIFSDISISQITLETEHCSLSVSCEVPVKSEVCAIGFALDNDDFDDYDEEVI